MALDFFKRPLRDLRISVTDRCNFRCVYCMPRAEYDWIDRHEILTFEEIARLAKLFADLGVRRIRLTGGEPLLRREIHELVARLSALPGIEDLSLTTNGALLGEQAEDLAAAGLRRVNVSLDSLDPEKFRRITQKNDLSRVLEGIQRARAAGLNPVKVNAVIERGVNDDEILGLVEFARERGLSLRFIEFMDVGNANGWHTDRMVPKNEILALIRSRYEIREEGREEGSEPAVAYRFADGSGDIGVIASVTEPFCGGCNRARLTADGRLVTCLFSETGHDLKALLRDGTSDARISERIQSVWHGREDRFSETRLEQINSAGGYDAKTRRKIEMIRLGG